MRGVPTRVYTAAPPDMRAIWEISSGYGDAEYLVYGNERYSYTVINNNFAAGFNETWTLKDAAAITCPTLTIMGMESVPLAQRVTEMLAETVTTSRLVMIPGAGHMVPLTDPHIVDPLISNHLRMAEKNPQPQAQVSEVHSLGQAA